MKYRCKECKGIHEYEREAVECCNFSIKIIMYHCRKCGRVHAYQDDADNCCKDDKIEEVEEEKALIIGKSTTTYLCDYCGNTKESIINIDGKDERASVCPDCFNSVMRRILSEKGSK